MNSNKNGSFGMILIVVIGLGLVLSIMDAADISPAAPQPAIIATIPAQIEPENIMPAFTLTPLPTAENRQIRQPTPTAAAIRPDTRQSNNGCVVRLDRDAPGAAVTFGYQQAQAAGLIYMRGIGGSGTQADPYQQIEYSNCR